MAETQRLYGVFFRMTESMWFDPFRVALREAGVSDNVVDYSSPQEVAQAVATSVRRCQDEQASLRDTTGAFERAQAGRDDAQATLGKTQAERDESRAALGQAREERDDARAALGQAQAERDDAQAALDKTQAERDESRAALGQAREERDDARAALGQAQEEWDDAQAALGQAREEREEARSEYRNEVDALTRQLSAKDQHQRTLVRTYRNEIANLEGTMRKMRRDHEDALRRLQEKHIQLVAEARRSREKQNGRVPVTPELREWLAAAHDAVDRIAEGPVADAECKVLAEVLRKVTVRMDEQQAQVIHQGETIRRLQAIVDSSQKTCATKTQTLTKGIKTANARYDDLRRACHTCARRFEEQRRKKLEKSVQTRGLSAAANRPAYQVLRGKLSRSHALPVDTSVFTHDSGDSPEREPSPLKKKTSVRRGRSASRTRSAAR